MPRFRRLPAAASVPVAVLALAAAVACPALTGRADSVVLKNGIVYRGVVDRDKPIFFIYDGLKRVVVRDSKVARIDPDPSYRTLETFRLEQPLVVHGGSMPKEVISVTASPWNDRGRRSFAYEGSRAGKFVRMEQAINEMGPHMVKIRGVDGYWQGQLATSQVPREIVMAILAKVDRKDRNERTRVARFLMQAGWLDEARRELEQIVRDFGGDPDLKERVNSALAVVDRDRAARLSAEADRSRLARQPKQAAARLKSVNTKEAAADVETRVREQLRVDEAQAAADRAEAVDLSALAGRLKKDEQARWAEPLNEALKALGEAPDAVRDRLVAWQKRKAEQPGDAEGQFALAMSGYVVGSDAAVADLSAARALWTLRDQVRDYLRSSEAATRDGLLSGIEGASEPAKEGSPAEPWKVLDVVTRLAARMPPPLHGDDEGGAAVAPGPGRTHRVRDDESEEPTEYAVSLPPEYHPLRSYPAVVALHDGTGPPAAISWWSAEAARRGYIVVAPEYKVTGQGREYLYSPSEHAAVELALRDAKRRYAIDSDRVFVAGQLVGANMAWDFGLAHPDLFAGVVVISGMPFKYVNRYMRAAERLPLYVALGSLAPASNEVIFGQILKPLIAKAWDVTYLEYLNRGLEDFPEEAPAVFDWMDRRRRDPYPKSFEAVSARACDNRFFGVVVREFQPGRVTAPEAVDGFGKNLNPATVKVTTSQMSNLLKVQVSGLKRFDVWVSPAVFDFKRRLEVRVNGRAYFKEQPRPDLGPLLEDLRIRGDRQQVYWLKVPVG
jgi:dienelactone hydrolase